jgi:hypothetical protein
MFSERSRSSVAAAGPSGYSVNRSSGSEGGSDSNGRDSRGPFCVPAPSGRHGARQSTDQPWLPHRLDAMVMALTELMLGNAIGDVSDLIVNKGLGGMARV